MMDAFSDPSVERVVVMGSSQFGKTEILNNVVGYFIDHDPSPMLIVEPTIDVGKSWSKDRLSSMVRDTKCLQSKVADVKSRDADNTVLHKMFHGGHITIAGANSAASLRARPIRIVLCDDIDAFPPSAGSEGDPVSLAVKRTTTFWNRKIGLFSTPTDEGSSKIEAEYGKSDQRKYYVPCPHCNEFQLMTFDNVKWPKSEPWNAHYECAVCGGIITDQDKARMILYGQWRKGAPDVKKIAGFWINELYSPWVTFAQVAEKFYASKKNPRELKVWTNTSLGEVWKQVTISVKSDELMKAKCALKPQTVPKDAVALTCGVDQQLSGYWFVVRAWAANMTSWMIHYGFLPTEQDLDNLIFNTSYPTEGGKSMPIWRVARDTGGTKGEGNVISMTEDSYWWIVKNWGRGAQLFGTKGASRGMATRFKVGEPLLQTPSGKSLPAWFRIISIDTDVMKDHFHYGLQQAVINGPGAFYLHSDTSVDYFRQITAEEKRINGKTGVEEWVKRDKMNHLLDAEVLCVSLAQPQWIGGGVNLLRKIEQSDAQTPQRVEKPKIKQGRW